MLEQLTELSEILVGLAIFGSLVYVGFQLRETRKQIQASVLQQAIDTRVKLWNSQLDTSALHSALDKYFEDELYKRDLLFEEIDELTLQERRALSNWLLIEIVYSQNQFYQRAQGILPDDQSQPTHLMRCMTQAPNRRQWKDRLRLTGHFPADFISHVDNIVKKYDQVEKVMDQDENADFESVVMQVFDIPAPPKWIN